MMNTAFVSVAGHVLGTLVRNFVAIATLAAPLIGFRPAASALGGYLWARRFCGR